jgi:hypothetical protein
VRFIELLDAGSQPSESFGRPKGPHMPEADGQVCGMRPFGSRERSVRETPREIVNHFHEDSALT